MSTAYVGEIRMFAGNFAPQGWALCNGALMSISDYEALFQLVGTTYGGDGVSTFGLPDLQGRTPIHMGSTSGGTFVEGQRSGSESVVLTLNQLPTHTHSVQASRTTGNAATPSNNVLASGTPGGIQVYTDDNSVTGTPTPVSVTGSNVLHENRQPLLAVTFIISLFGVFPSQN
jgi:microcystin-dependent protein